MGAGRFSFSVFARVARSNMLVCRFGGKKEKGVASLQPTSYDDNHTTMGWRDATPWTHMKLSFTKIVFIGINFLFLSTQIFAAEPTLSIEISGKGIVKTYTRHELLAKAEKQTLIINYTPIYQGKMIHYTVVAAASLFDHLGVKTNALIQFKTLDGFSAPIDTKKLLNRDPKGAIAYIAIEDEQHKWPAIKKTSTATPGPFYLVWKNPQLSDVREEEWPFQLSGFQVRSSLRELFPEIFPSSSLPENSPVNRGFKSFTQNCFACHTLNKSGDSKIGPDLNTPHNPTEYFQADYLKMLIRDPQKLRYWPQAKMRGFSEESMSNAELDDLIAYLKHMSTRKV